MERGSSQSGLDKCSSSRGLNAYGQNHQENRVDVSSESLNDVRFALESKERRHNNQPGSSGVCWNGMGVDGNDCAMGQGDVSLRQWLDTPRRSVDRMECLHIYRQIVETVDLAHSQGVVVHNVRPSCFVMSSVNRVSFIESASCSTSGSDSCEDAMNNEAADAHSHLHPQSEEELPQSDTADASKRTCDTRAHPMCQSSIEEAEEGNTDDSTQIELDTNRVEKVFPLKKIMIMEMSWYTSPEEVDGCSTSFSSDVYRLGVLLFELFCTFSSMDEKLVTMSNLRHRVLPPQLLLNWPKEASFCMWLLHPQPNSRPKMCEVLSSEFLNGARDSLEEREAAIKLKEELEEHELLLEFLLMMQQRKREAAEKLQNIVGLLSLDIDEVTNQLSIITEKGGSLSEPGEDDLIMEKVGKPSINCAKNEHRSRKRSRSGHEVHGTLVINEHETVSSAHTTSQENVSSTNSRMMKNFKKLESAYFSTRCRLVEPTEKSLKKGSQISGNFRGSTLMTEGSKVDDFTFMKGRTGSRKSEWINPFLGNLCKYLSISKLKVKADLKQGDLLNSSNLVCSLSFDRDREFFATAGVNRKIKIFECDMILSEHRDIHYPVVEMASRSKLSSICWNGYIKNQIASSDFDGVVQVWDVTRSQVFTEMREHERRVWSVDFSLTDPTNLASGSDDFTVKLWNINQAILLLHSVDSALKLNAGSVGTIKTRANVCCVQFPPDSARLLAIGSADHKIYYYDLRNAKTPLYTLNGHAKTVSYVKFLDPTTIVSASTDSSIKLWDLSKCSSRELDSPIQTFTGHTNLKNFVGLSISDGYIATGSETNEVFVYHKGFPMPVLSFKFSNTDPLSGHELDDSLQFVSSVCWRGQSSTLVAANSTGNIKVLEMV